MKSAFMFCGDNSNKFQGIQSPSSFRYFQGLPFGSTPQYNMRFMGSTGFTPCNKLIPEFGRMTNNMPEGDMPMMNNITGINGNLQSTN